MRRRLRPAGLAALVVCTGLVAGGQAAAGPQFYGSTGGQRLNAPVTTIVRTASGAGYFLFAEDGGVFTFGDAAFRGSMGHLRLNGPVVDGALTITGDGYYMVGRDGGVFSFGGAVFRGSLGNLRLNAPIVGLATTPDGGGYVMVASDGGVFAFGSARFYGSLGASRLGSPAVGIALRPQGDGYWIALADGRVFPFGAAPDFGRASGLAAPITSIQPAPAGDGYFLFATDGGAFTFGAARFHGSLGTSRLNAPVIDAAITGDGDGYWILGRDGGVFVLPGPVPPGPGPAPTTPGTPHPTGTPTLSVTTVASGLTIPWDLGFLPDGNLVFTERSGKLEVLINGAGRVLAQPADIMATGEGGMTGLAIDPAFASNRRVYTCMNTNAGDIKVIVWTLDEALTTATRVGNLVTGLPQAGNGRHSGCRPRVGSDGFLWIGTGDAATGTNPQNANSLGGKVLRVDRFTGAAAPGNPGGRLWYTLGHRNVQGIAFRPSSGATYNVEQGTDRDDEVNLLVNGGNYGWNPVPGYDESKPMTFAGGVPAVWSSGSPTIATSGGAFLNAPQWRDWDGALVACALAGRRMKVFILDAPGTAVVAELSVLTSFGRLRTPVMGPDGNLYITTSNGGGTDRILRVTPS